MHAKHSSPPGHTCPAIDRAIRYARRMVREQDIHARQALMAKFLNEMERVRSENTQMRAAWASERDRRKALEQSR